MNANEIHMKGPADQIDALRLVVLFIRSFATSLSMKMQYGRANAMPPQID